MFVAKHADIFLSIKHFALFSYIGGTPIIIIFLGKAPP